MTHHCFKYVLQGCSLSSWVYCLWIVGQKSNDIHGPSVVPLHSCTLLISHWNVSVFFPLIITPINIQMLLIVTEDKQTEIDRW